MVKEMRLFQIRGQIYEVFYWRIYLLMKWLHFYNIQIHGDKPLRLKSTFSCYKKDDKLDNLPYLIVDRKKIFEKKIVQ